ncbi:restriction endonuclease subunit S [Flavobacterium sp. 1]|uniref:restriction endonuclease subunit S n=1 Tax=Flavobacterium sp. 1 TaxID=2035200 RepID=UPI0018E21C03|nr:restriction endonuclease subunit S [Flavobacterium sp. 1]
MKKYDKYKNSGVEWLSDIPEHWEVLPGLSFIYENKDRNKGMVRNTVLSLSYGNIRVKRENELTGLVPESFETYQFVNKGDLIFRPTDLQNDTVSLRSSISEYEGIITNAYLNLRFRSKANSKFYHYFFRSIDNNKIIYGLGSGLRQNISYLDFRRFQFPFPPIEEQTAIANFLDDKTAKIDQAITIKQKQIELLKERRQILIHKTVTRGLIPNIKLKESGVEWIGEIPKHWEIKRFRNTFKLGKGLTITKENLTDEGIFCVNYGEIHSKFGFEVNPEIHKLKCVHPDYLINNSSSLINEDDFVFADTSEDLQGSGNFTYLNSKEQVFAGYHTVIARPSDNIISRFIAYEFDSLVFRSQIQAKVKGVKVYSITQSILKELSVLVPPKKEQLEIVNHLDNSTKKIDTAISLKKQEIEKLKEYKMSLIDAVVTGKVKVF